MQLAGALLSIEWNALLYVKSGLLSSGSSGWAKVNEYSGGLLPITEVPSIDPFKLFGS